MLNLLITRMNYILYFTALVNNIETFTLYKLYSILEFENLDSRISQLTIEEAPQHIFVFPEQITITDFNNWVYQNDKTRTFYQYGINPNIGLSPGTNIPQPPQESIHQVSMDSGINVNPTISSYETNITPTFTQETEKQQVISPLMKRMMEQKNLQQPNIVSEEDYKQPIDIDYVNNFIKQKKEERNQQVDQETEKQPVMSPLMKRMMEQKNLQQPNIVSDEDYKQPIDIDYVNNFIKQKKEERNQQVQQENRIPKQKNMVSISF
jgi:hypothetical protein